MRRDGSAGQSSAEESDFMLVLFISLAGLDLSLWLSGHGFAELFSILML